MVEWERGGDLFHLAMELSDEMARWSQDTKCPPAV